MVGSTLGNHLTDILPETSQSTLVILVQLFLFGPRTTFDVIFDLADGLHQNLHILVGFSFSAQLEQVIEVIVCSLPVTDVCVIFELCEDCISCGVGLVLLGFYFALLFLLGG